MQHATHTQQESQTGNEFETSDAHELKVLGSGCKACHKQLENVQKALKQMGVDLDVEYITDLQQVVGYGVMGTPAIVLDEKVLSSGRVLSPGSVKELLSKDLV